MAWNSSRLPYGKVKAEWASSIVLDIFLGISVHSVVLPSDPEALATRSDLYERPAQVPLVHGGAPEDLNVSALNAAADSESRTMSATWPKC